MSQPTNRRRLDLQRDVNLNLQLLSLLEDPSPISSLVDPEPKTELEEATANLRQMLSLDGVLPSTSSAAERDTAAHSEDKRPFRQIGVGTCGVIFTQDGASLVVKLAKNDAMELWNDYVKHKKIAKQFKRVIIEGIQIPACYFFVPAGKTGWWEKYPGLTEAAKGVCNLPTCALLTERIHPLPKPTRTAIIERYCDPKVKQQALEAPGNKDCLVRVYLGSVRERAPQFFNLRNFKLYLNWMVELQLDVDELARRMGVALAVMHWAARTDANDVEFVLGSSTTELPAEDGPEDPEKKAPLTYTGPPSEIIEDFFNRRVELWVLDFDKVQTITMDDAGVAQAAHAFLVNDPYFPRPCRESAVEKRMWREFVAEYIYSSLAILRDDEEYNSSYLELPRKFIFEVTEAERKRLAERKC